MLGIAQMNVHFNPLSMRATGAFNSQASGNAQITYDIWTYLGMAQDFVAGVLDTVTVGLTSDGRKALGMTWLVDPTTDSYRYGVYVGEAINILLTLFPPTGLLGLAIRGVQVAGALVSRD